MSKINQIISEQCAKDILNAYESNQKPDEISMKNLLTSTACLIKDGDLPGENFYRLHRYLDAQYAYTDISDKPGFSAGAVFGSLSILKEFEDLK